MNRKKIALIVGLSGLSLCGQARAHDQWADGSAIPAWVKASCCGPADAHHLSPDQVHDEGDHYMVDGYNHPIFKKAANIIPSQDGSYWIFYRDDASGSQSSVYCFFVPMDF